MLSIRRRVGCAPHPPLRATPGAIDPRPPASPTVGPPGQPVNRTLPHRPGPCRSLLLALAIVERGGLPRLPTLPEISKRQVSVIVTEWPRFWKPGLLAA